MSTKAENSNAIVSVVLVGLNARRYVEECLQSLRAASWGSYGKEIIYVDNGSSDATLDMIARYPEVRLLANATNVGYCKAANQGARMATGHWLYFLNDDTLVIDDAVPVLADYLRKHPEVAVAGSRLLNTNGTEQWSGRRFPSVWNGILARRSVFAKLMPRAKPLRDYLYQDEIARGLPFEADWVSAAALMVSRVTFDSVGGFAEDYYYWHEAVFCDRIKRAGHGIVLHPGSRVIHHEGKGSGARPYKVRRFHIVNFHVGAFRCYLQHYGHSKFDPRVWGVAVALGARAALLLAAARLRYRS